MFDAEDDDQWFLHNTVSASQVYQALMNHPELASYKNADVRTYGKAMAYVPGWEFLGQLRRYGEKNRWYRRVGGDDHRFTAILNISAHRDMRELEDLI